MLTKYDFYFCYSRNLKNHLELKGLPVICNGVNSATGKTFWLFQKCSELSSLLTAWSNAK